MSKSKDPSINDTVQNYLEKTNRPFSGNDIFNNLNAINNKLGKTAVIKALDDLAAKQLIKEKINGKQKLYFADQTRFTDISDQKLKQMDEQISQLNRELDQLRDGLKEKGSKVSSFKNSMSLEEIESKLNAVNKEINELRIKLETLNSKVKDFDPKQNEQVKNERQKLVTEWKKRKRMATSMIEMILEGYPKPKKVLMEEIGIETDEEMKATMPQV